MASVALARFLDEVKEVGLLLSSLPDESGIDEASEGFRHARGVHRAAAVLLTAHLEGFTRSLIVEYFETLVSPERASKVKALPKAFRRRLTRDRLTEAVGSADHRQQEALFRKLPEVYALWNDDAVANLSAKQIEQAGRALTSLSPEVVEEVFAEIGFEELCAGHIHFVVNDQTNYVSTRTMLQDLVNCRNDIAHHRNDRAPTADDCRRYLGFAEAFAQRLDGVLWHGLT